MTKKRNLSLLILIFLTFWVNLTPQKSYAATVNFTVSATIADVCAIAATNMVFLNYNPVTGANNTATSTITTTCTVGSNPTISLTAGSSGSFAARTMVSGGNQITYNLYTDAAHTTVWGDGTGGTSTKQPGVSTGVPILTTVYGQITPPIQVVATGAYSDTITATTNF
jgi:spore coat protein U-like protein